MRPFDDQDRNDTNKEVIYKEKNGYKWSFKEPNKTVKTPCRNIIVKLPSIKPYDRFQFYWFYSIDILLILIWDSDRVNQVYLYQNHSGNFFEDNYGDNENQ